MPMPTTLTYNPPSQQKPAKHLRTYTCRYVRYVEPLPPRPTANYSLLTANSSFTFPQYAESPTTIVICLTSSLPTPSKSPCPSC